MIKIAAAFLVILAAFSIVSEANAVVCARGVYRAGCAGPNGAVVARRRAKMCYRERGSRLPVGGAARDRLPG
jgi:hypothetical protein